jgi:hypothetical protein
MVSLTGDQFGRIVPAAGTGPMSRVWQRMRGGPAEDRQARWWEERRTAAGEYGDVVGARPEAEPGPGGRVPARRAGRRPDEIEPTPPPALVPGARRPALPSGPDGFGGAGGMPSWAEPGEVDDRVIYRRPDAVPLRPGAARPVQPEIVDGVPVYRIYRPRTAQPIYYPAGSRDAH